MRALVASIGVTVTETMTAGLEIDGQFGIGIRAEIVEGLDAEEAVAGFTQQRGEGRP